jgi:hypothetical protein
VVTLSDWSFEPPGSIISNLKQQAGYYNFEKRTAADFFPKVAMAGWRRPRNVFAGRRYAWTR